MQGLSELCLGKEVFSEETLNWIAENKLWNIWLPKTHGGLECALAEGLQKLRKLAETDGSLGWTVTLCSGANFFFGNLKKEVTDAIFLNSEKPVCFGGSGGVFGTAEKQGEGYIISGTWKYATGAPHLSHFTLNAKILENGRVLKNEEGMDVVRSFVLDKDNVKIIPDWNAMGLKATATHSFKIKEKWVHSNYSFLYNEVYHDAPIFKIDFSVFADLTLWVNYIGMADGFCNEAKTVQSHTALLKDLENTIAAADSALNKFVFQIEETINSGGAFSEKWVAKIHNEASNSVKALSKAIIDLYPMLGIRACNENENINRIFKDYFTATQHRNFTR
ncbi:acyl-CoA dehydrogenase [Tamlana crocina]|uniref:Acyl-CoA dehydrogenase n=1 Tax=Tamlana crocina TaxID=393006 RepID=A0ABX1D7Z5_9FLAO|nr:acyl-CoA dehydrogenase [Tamlana crocina]NJX14082.1 acyl-CoA dehydrogenase [Tamlana crocina]